MTEIRMQTIVMVDKAYLDAMVGDLTLLQAFVGEVAFASGVWSDDGEVRPVDPDVMVELFVRAGLLQEADGGHRVSRALANSLKQAEERNAAPPQ